jgi:hypothetical protein
MLRAIGLPGKLQPFSLATLQQLPAAAAGRSSAATAVAAAVSCSRRRGSSAALVCSSRRAVVAVGVAAAAAAAGLHRLQPPACGSMADGAEGPNPGGSSAPAPSLCAGERAAGLREVGLQHRPFL